MKLLDAHNHLQDQRLKPHEGDIISTAKQAGVIKMVVNGSCEADWSDVLGLAKRHPELVIPSFGLHPWYVAQRSDGWEVALKRMLEATPSAVGEIGLDKWILERPLDSSSPKPATLTVQEEAFIFQLRLAAERNLPPSIHCLRAWGRLLELLRYEARPKCGFILHSFGGPKEMIPKLAELGAYFSLPGHFAHERKERRRDAFRHVPLDRLLIETDAPDQCLPENRLQFPLKDNAGKAINHPANLKSVYDFAAELTGVTAESLSEIVETNFNRVFGGIRQKSAR